MENIFVLSAIIAVLLFAFLFSGQWVGLALATVGIIMLVFMVGDGQVAMVGRLQFNIANMFILAAIPLFIFMGFIFINSGMTDLVYRAVSPVVSIFPGGLLHTNVVGGSVLGAACGTSVAGTVAITTVALPQLQKRQYDKTLTYGSLAAGGTMSALIPPSGTMIIYGAWVGESVGKLFMAGIIPGVIMTLAFMVYMGVRAVRNPHLAPKERVSIEVMLRGLLNIIPMIILVVGVLGSIYAGIATPTEAAGMGVFITLVLAAAYRRLNWQVIRTAAWEAAKLTCMVMLLVVGAQFFAMGISALRIPQTLTELLTHLEIDRTIILGSVMVLYIVLGMFMEATAILLMTLPLTYPVLMALGYNSVWFGIIVVVLVQVGLLSPPFGMDVFIVNKIAEEKNIGIGFRGAMPFMLIMLLESILLIAYPKIVTWLPSQML